MILRVEEDWRFQTQLTFEEPIRVESYSSYCENFEFPARVFANPTRFERLQTWQELSSSNSTHANLSL